MIPRGLGLFVAPDVWVRTDGTVFVKLSTAGLADNEQWMEWGKLGSGILDNILKYKIASKQVSYGQYPAGQLPIGSTGYGGGAALPNSGLNYGVSGPGLFGSINPVYLLLAAGAAMFVFMRK